MGSNIKQGRRCVIDAGRRISVRAVFIAWTLVCFSHAVSAQMTWGEEYAKRLRAAETVGPLSDSLMGDSVTLKQLDAAKFVDDRFGLPTVRDILAELEKPGRDPRPEFRTATFAEGVNQVADLKPGMVLEGTVTNVAAFGAFVDIGVHQDGLVHVSQLADRFVKDPRDVVKAGQIVKVRVLDVDIKRKRISLTMRKDSSQAGASAPRTDRDARNTGGGRDARGGKPEPRDKPPQGALGAALAEALRLKT